MRILISTGALTGRPTGMDYRPLARYAQELDCDGFEFMMSSLWYDSIPDIIAFFRENDISAPTYHCQKNIGESISKGGKDEFESAFSRFEVNAEMAARLGASKLILHLWDGITSDRNFENNIEAYPRLKKISDSYGLDLLIENVVCNCASPMQRLSELAAVYPDIRFVFDTKMAAFHDQLKLLYTDDYAWLWKEGHIVHYHVNDYGGGYMDWASLRTLPIGRGNIDFDRFFAFLKSIGYDDTLTLESTAFNKEGVVDLEMLKTQLTAVRGYIGNS